MSTEYASDTITALVTGNSESTQPEAGTTTQFCSLPPMPEPVLGPDVAPGRARLILMLRQKWVNGTVLRYYFFDKDTDGQEVRLSNGTKQFVPWKAPSDAEKEAVRQAFAQWKAQGIGLEFKEVATREEAEIRIGFMRFDGSWSYIGRDVLGQGKNSRTMNFGWNLSGQDGDFDTALHEIGHTLGFPHEHQNPMAGIEWDEEAVIADLAKPPNSWSRDKTHFNIIRKIEPDTVQGSSWDFNSIMHYPFRAGLIKKPDQFKTQPLIPAGGLSARDIEWAKSFYPPLKEEPVKLTAFKSHAFTLKAAEQIDFVIEPTQSRKYQLGTFGDADVVLVLFEDVNGDLRYVGGDDDSGEDRNALLKQRLTKGRRYVARLRMYYNHEGGESAVMYW